MWSAAALVLASLSLAQPQVEPDTLILRTGSEFGSYRQAGLAMARLLEDSISGLTVIVQTSTGSVGNVLALGRGDADLAIAQSDVASHGVRGEAMFLEPGPQDISAVMGLFPEDVLVIAGEELSAPSVSLLDPGLTMVVGREGSGTLDNARDVMDALGYGLGDMDTVMADPRSSLPLLGTDSAQIIFLTGGVDEEFWSRVTEVRGRPLSMGDELVQLLQRERRYYRATAFDFQGETIHTVRVRAVLLARSDLPAPLVERVTRILHGGLNEIRASNEWAKHVLPRTVREYVPIRWHRGANAYYCAQDMGGCQPVVSYFLLLLALLGAGFVALGFSATLRSAFSRTAPRVASMVVGPHGVTDRYRYLVIPVLARARNRQNVPVRARQASP